MNRGWETGNIYRLYQKKIHLGSFVLFVANQGKEDRSVERDEN